MLYKCEQVRQNLLVNDLGKNCCNVFMQKQLTVFSSIDRFYFDGTFKSAPKFFHQIFTIHGLTMCNLHFSYRPININVLWGCISSTVSGTAKLCVNVLPTIVYADFESAIYNTVTTVWPGLEVKSCRLYLGHSCWRKMQSLGLSKQYGKKDSEVSQFLKKIFWLLLLPPEEVCDCFTLEFLSNLPNDKRVEQFCDYLLENCIDADSNFLLPVWSECTASSLRTINACELFHAHFNALFYSTHYKIFVLVSTLQKIQNETYIKMRSVTT